MEDYYESTKDRIERLMFLLSDREEREFGKLNKDNEDGSFVVEYPSNHKGLEYTNKFLEKLQIGGFIKDGDAPVINTKAVYTKMDFCPINQDLALKINEHHAQIIFTPSGEYKAIVSGLKTAIKSAEEDAQQNTMWVKEHRKLSPAIGLPAGAEAVCEYLREKTKSTFPNSNAKVTCSKKKNLNNQKSTDSEFTVIFDYKAGNNPTPINNFLKELNVVLGNTNIATFPINIKKTKIGFNISGNPIILLGYIKRNDPANFPNIEQQPAVAR